MNNAFFSLLFCFVMFGCEAPTTANDTDKEHASNHSAKGIQKIIQGKVVGISDGDTFKLLVDGNQTIRVRLYGVDAPEKGQDYATQSRQKLSDLVFSKEATVEERDIDRYGRTVGIVYINKLNVNEELLRTGYAWHYTQYDNSKAWAQLMREAQQRRAGLWAKGNPTPPWQWRKLKRETTVVEQ